MSFDPATIEFVPNNWFATGGSYEGWGKAEFTDPPGMVEGPAQIVFDEFGTYEVTLDITPSSTETDMSVDRLLVRQGPYIEAYRIVVNPCANLTVSTPAGTLTASGPTKHSRHQYQLTFRPANAHFDVPDAGEPVYWVLPLQNFVSAFTERHPALDQHPLRIYPTPSLPNDVPPEELFLAEYVVNQKNTLIVFSFNKQLAWIEPLADYQNRANKLLTEQQRRNITSVMVGEVGDQPIDAARLETWFPFDVLRLLSFATGIEVSAPWLEFRDAHGGLVRRIHFTGSRPTFTRGHMTIDEAGQRRGEDGVHRGIGHLLTQALSVPQWGTSDLSVLLKHVTWVGLKDLSVEDKLTYIYRALDGLCTTFDLYTLHTHKLAPEVQATIKTTLKLALKQIRELANQQRKKEKGVANQQQKEEAANEAQILEDIHAYIGGWPQKLRPGFVKAVFKLLEQFGLPDGQIVEAYYNAHPRPDKRRWLNVLPYYRQTVIHRSYFDFVGNTHDFDDVVRVMYHLHDLLLRIVLKLVAYEGTYQPAIPSLPDGWAVDWVTPTTPAYRLGYE